MFFVNRVGCRARCEQLRAPVSPGDCSQAHDIRGLLDFFGVRVRAGILLGLLKAKDEPLAKGCLRGRFC